ncbi:hypothetical protein D3I48_RS14355 [Enterococcus hirae]|nr:hypothetical protein [Enterococcus hirae]
MDLILRNIDSKYVTEIDQRCKELSNRTGNKWSRNDYLKLLVENDFDRPLMEYKQEKFDQLLDKFSAVQSYNTKVLEEYIGQNNQILELLIEQSQGGERAHVESN